MNRLLPQVTPTLIRINKSLAIDLDNLDENGDAVLVKLETPQQPHLIAPNDFDCPLGLNDTSDCGQDIWNPKAPQKDQTAKNQEASDSSRCEEAILSCEDRLLQEDDQPQTAKVVKFQGIEASTQTSPEDHEKLAQIDAESQTLPDDQDIPPRIEAETQTLPDDQEKLARFEAETQTLTEEPTRDQLLLQCSQLKSDYEKIIKENSLLKLAQSEQPKIPTTNKSAANSLTKPQLYMAIKKYLGPTMAALLRIELFGGSEDRSWKEDEQEFAVELLQLGEEVYKYCCDEWRFRLPPLRLARTWLETENQTSKDDETLDL
ncbi:hypothetical protein KR026_011671 [Drosophila bipectinata]|nr:hypothetical protein KR026_011671 [Drosophila bipectinata]